MHVDWAGQRAYETRRLIHMNTTTCGLSPVFGANFTEMLFNVVKTGLYYNLLRGEDNSVG